MRKILTGLTEKGSLGDGRNALHFSKVESTNTSFPDTCPIWSWRYSTSGVLVLQM